MTINVSHIQRFSTGDGPGIRTTVFFKGCPLRCPWCHNPETVSPEPQTLFYRQTGKTVVCGRTMTPEEISAEAEEDAEFYRAGGGGVTLSGGEPLLQYRGAAELAAILADRGIPTLIDTAGNVPWAAFEAVRGTVRQFYYDVKTADAARYARLGGDLDRIAENLRRLVAGGAEVRVRIPFIPGFNTSDEDCRRIGRLVADAGARRADLLPFHRLGGAKYEALGLTYTYRDVRPPDRAELLRAAEIYKTFLEVGIE
ncbi:MAG: radical SAM protein [Oscillospiraceae bacterium]|nr:radical SAM protein [Oscillospiraceae bacterium]